jgi:hypothetical protein
LLKISAIIGGVFSVALSVNAFWALPRCYLAVRPLEPGLSSNINHARDHPTDSIQMNNNQYVERITEMKLHSATSNVL